LLAALNGVLGDYLAAPTKPLMITMRPRRGDIAVPGQCQPLAAALPHASGKLVVQLHGLCMYDLQWKSKGREAPLDLGATGSTCAEHERVLRSIGSLGQDPQRRHQ